MNFSGEKEEFCKTFLSCDLSGPSSVGLLDSTDNNTTIRLRGGVIFPHGIGKLSTPKYRLKRKS